MLYRNGDHMFVVFEGIDGAGKSTVAKAVAERVDGVYYKTPSALLADASVPTVGEPTFMRRYVEELSHVPTRYLYYLFVTAHDSTQIAALLTQNHVICDRYLYSALAYHRALQPTLKGLSLDPLQFLQPDITFHLKVNQQEQVRRLSTRPTDPRGNSGWHDENFPLLERVER